MTILLVGQNGFIAQALLSVGRAGYVGISHDEPPPRTSHSCLIYAGRDPALARMDYDVTADAEWRWARWARAHDCHFVHLGSRKVYRESSEPLREDSPLGPTDAYGRNKLAMERRLLDLLEDRLTILRIGNAFGFERGRKSFFGAMLDRLASAGEIAFDMDPAVRRDFLQVEIVARAIEALALARVSGVVNVASGVAMPVGRLAQSVIQGYGHGRLVIETTRRIDEFVMDVARMNELTGIRTDSAAIIERAKELGRRLRGPVA